MNKTDTERGIAMLPYIAVVIIAACGFLSASGTSLAGDDLKYALEISARFPQWYQWPLVIPAHWLTTNGRLADMAGSLLLGHAPLWLMAALCGCFQGLFYFMAAKLAFPDRHSAVGRMAVIAAIMFTFQWWDSFYLFVCQANYVWPSALMLLILWLALFRRGRELPARAAWLLAPLGLMAGWSHEAAGMPVAAALVFYFLFIGQWRKLPAANRIVLGAVVTGGLLTVTSPGAYSRLAAAATPDDTPAMLIIRSAYWVIVLAAAVAACLIRECARKRALRETKIGELWRGPWTVLALAASGSTVFVAVGGIVGRSGFFAQTYALVALAILIRKLYRPSFRESGGLVTVILFLLTMAHAIGVCSLQTKANAEMRMCRRLFGESADGAVYASPTQRDEFPWWALYKNKACIDNDDYWQIEVYDRYAGNGRKHYRLLPPELKAIDPGSLPLSLDNGGCVAASVPAGLDESRYTPVTFTAASGDTLIYLSPRVIDPGDR